MSIFGWTLRTLALGVPLTLALFAVPQADAQQKVKVTLQVEGLLNTKGQLVVSVYKDEDSFMEMDEAFKTVKKPISGKKMTLAFELPPGTYGIGVLHDEDKNGKLKQWFWVGPPKEGVGASRNPDGIPKWKKCAVKIDQDKTLKIKMRYLGKKAGKKK